MSTSKYVLVKGKRLHVQIMGTGPALVLMHPSPHTSEMLLPIAKELASHYTTICIDTPGYGKSDGLGFKPNSLEDYTDFLHEAFKHLNLKRPFLYGSATGAQLAIRYAINYPNEVSHVFLDNSAHFGDDLRNKILENYFPDLTPKKDGSHLITVWKIVSQIGLYFPWCFTTEEYALHRSQMPKELRHYIARDFLIAGANYDYAYRAAFIHEKGEYVAALTVPTTIYNWKGSIIKDYIDDLLKFELPINVQSLDLPIDKEERTIKMIQDIKAKSNGVKCELNNIEDSEPYDLQEKINYQSSNISRPSITDDGVYLIEAWESLVSCNPSLNSEEIQSSLIDWYSKT